MERVQIYSGRFHPIFTCARKPRMYVSFIDCNDKLQNIYTDRKNKTTKFIIILNDNMNKRMNTSNI